MTDSEHAYLAEDFDDDVDIKVVKYLNPSGEHYVGVYFDNMETELADHLISVFKKNRDRVRRAAVAERDKANRRQARVEKAKKLLVLDDVWYTSTNESIAIKKMTPRHAERSLNLVVNDFGRWVGDSTITYEELGFPRSVKASPLVKALTERSQVKETRRHRELDALSDTVFRAARSGGRLNLWEMIDSFDKVRSGPA